MQALDDILRKAESEIKVTHNLQALAEYRVHYLGKKGILTEYLKQLGQLSVDERPIVGQKVNSIKQAIQALIEQRKIELEKQAVDSAIASEAIDITLSGREGYVGSLHPVTKTINHLEQIFMQMGFDILQGPEIEHEDYNFTALNIPPLHPARAMMATFYLSDAHLLRTHMSPVQIHAMKRTPPPLRMIAIGRVYRRDFDLTHTPMFHQVEGLMVDKNISFADLKGMLKVFLYAFFEKEVPIRFRPSYFPFTEPSAEVDIGCQSCQGKGCRICKDTGWLEVLGSGMVHPNVLKNVGIDSKQFSGFAFGLGIDRITLLKYGISDLRTLFENDVRFLKQF